MFIVEMMIPDAVATPRPEAKAHRFLSVSLSVDADRPWMVEIESKDGVTNTVFHAEVPLESLETIVAVSQRLRDLEEARSQPKKSSDFAL